MRFHWFARAGLVVCGLVAPFLMEPASLVISPNAEIEPNNTPATATVLNLTSCPPAVSGSITPVGDVDYYSFVAPANAKLWARVDTAASTSGTDSILTLFGPDGTTVLETDDDDGLGNGCDTTIETMFASAIAGRTLSAAGTYYLQVKHFSPPPPSSPSGTITPYTLEVVLTTASAGELESNDTAVLATPIVTALTSIGVRTAEIKPAGDVDYYSVVAAAGSSLFVSVDQDPNKDATTMNPSGADVVIDVIAPDLTTVLMTVDITDDTGFPAPPAESFCFGVATAGTYFVRVSGYTLPPTISATGKYSLMVSNCSPVAATPTPTNTPTATPSNTPTGVLPTNTPTSTPTPTVTPVPTLTFTPTPTPTPTSGPLVAGFYTLVPCRVADTRGATGPYGGPALSALTSRDFVMAGRCGIPPEADALAVNVTVTESTAGGHITIYPVGVPLPLASTINYRAGQTRANNAIVPLGTNDSIAVFCGQSSGTTHFLIDVVGYFRFVGP